MSVDLTGGANIECRASFHNAVFLSQFSPVYSAVFWAILNNRGEQKRQPNRLMSLMNMSGHIRQTSQKRLFLSAWVISAMLVFGAAHAGSMTGNLLTAGDLTRDARISKQDKKPILVFFTSESCPYCEIVRDLYLQPMQADKAYDNKVIIREVSIEGIGDMKNFQGERMDHETFADQEGATLTPVIRIYSPTGQLLTPELIGYSSPDFYLGFLEDSIEDARNKLRKLAANN